MNSVPQYLTEYLNKIAKDEGFIEHTCHYSESNSKKRENFVATIVEVNIKGQVGDGGEKELRLICKLEDKARRGNYHSTLCFEREVYVYNKIFPLFESFQIERNISLGDGFYHYPKCYLAVADADKDRYVIIMENVETAGYQLLNIREAIDFDTSSILLATLGRLHGLSFALQDQKPDLFQELLALPENFIKIMDPGLVKLIAMTIDEVMDNLTREDEINFFRKLKNDFPAMIKHLLAQSDAGQFKVLIHGDCWTNNFCVRSDSNKNPSGICFFDWYASASRSPAFDLCYYLLSSTTKAVRDRYDDLIKIYHDSMSEIITKLGSDPKKLCPFDELQCQFRQFGLYGVILGPMLIQTTVLEEAIVVKRLQGSSAIKFRELVSDVLQDAARFGWIHL